MARAFDANLSNYLSNTSWTVDIPFTIACWATIDATDQQNVVVSLADNTDATYYALMVANGTPTARHIGATGDDAQASDSIGGTGVWRHICGVWAATNDRRCFLDGASKGTNTNVVAAEGPNEIAIGQTADSTAFGPHSGEVAEVAIWNVALTDGEIALLGAGAHPFQIRPQNLISYPPLVYDVLDRAETRPSGGPFHLTINGTVPVAPHPPKIHRVAPLAAQFIETGELYEMSETLSHWDFTTPVRMKWAGIAAAPAANAPTADIQGPLRGPLGGPLAV